MTTFLEPLGERVDRERLVSERARQLTVALENSSIPFARLIECRIGEDVDVVVLDAEVELPQRRTYPIEPFERIAVLFDRNDSNTPEVLSLREGFPWTPHINLRTQEFPRSLCLYDEPFRDIKRRWTPQRFVEQIRNWLALTAKGKLHQDDQPLEPLLFGQVGTIVLPADLLDPDPAKVPDRLTITSRNSDAPKLFLVADRSARRSKDKGLRVVASVHRCKPQRHGLIRFRPGNIRDLASFVTPTGLDLLGELRTRLREWKEESTEDSTLLDDFLALVIVMPKIRDGGDTAESQDIWAFLSSTNLREAGQKLGLWQIEDGVIGHIIGGDLGKTGEDIKLDLLNPSLKLTRQAIATLNGHEPEAAKLAAVGVGALGSQVAMNLARGGFGSWTLIDDDRLMPHNVARHVLCGDLVGFGKAAAVAISANSLVDDDPPFKFISADIVDPGDKADRLEAALEEASLILDMSASVTVARHLAALPRPSARRASLFLTPTGEDLVLLAEDRNRSIRLDSLEMQYYRALATNKRLEGHFRPRDQRHRYGQSCRDITSDLPQDLVALHAAIGSRAVRSTLASPTARIVVWRADREGNVRRIDIGAAPSVQHCIGEWNISIDAALVLELAAIRESKLPKETGGVLLGSFDLRNKIIYIAHTIASPPDSEEWPTLYIRGCKGLRRSVDDVSRMTDGMLEYIGEWHSHPSGCSTRPSDDDMQVFAWLTEVMSGEGLPAVMMIVGDGGDASCFVGQMAKAEELLPRAASQERDLRGDDERSP